MQVFKSQRVQLHEPFMDAGGVATYVMFMTNFSNSFWSLHPYVPNGQVGQALGTIMESGILFSLIGFVVIGPCWFLMKLLFLESKKKKKMKF